MTDTAIELSVVMPAYNEQHSIAAAIDDVLRFVVEVVPTTEIIIIDDGSTDRTGAIVKALAAGDRRITYLHQRNAGHGPAVIAGLSASRGDSVLLIDSDRQIALEDFALHWQAYRERQALLGIRRPRYDGRHREVLSAIMKMMIRLLFGTAPQDAGTPFKLVRRTHWLAIAPHMRPDNPIPAVLLATYLVSRVGDIAQHPVRHRPRTGSPSTLRFARLLTFCIKASVAIMTFRTDIPRARAGSS